MNRLRVIVLFVVFGSGPAICAAQEGPRASVDLSGGYVGFGDEGLIDHFAIGSGMQWAITRRLSVGPEIVYMVGPHADRDVFVTVKAVFGFIPDAVVEPYVVADAGLVLHRSGGLTGTSWFTESGGSVGGGVRTRASDRVSVGLEGRLGWEAHLRVTGVVTVKLGS
jgi:hypothetical protein